VYYFPKAMEASTYEEQSSNDIDAKCNYEEYKFAVRKSQITLCGLN